MTHTSKKKTGLDRALYLITLYMVNRRVGNTFDSKMQHFFCRGKSAFGPSLVSVTAKLSINKINKKNEIHFLICVYGNCFPLLFGSVCTFQCKQANLFVVEKAAEFY